MSAVLTLTTDFGVDDAYVASMKGVILGINPGAQLVDVCHTIGPQNVAEAAFVLGTAVPHFPRRTVHLVVVDPGVGTQRRAVVLRTLEADFVAPDNGVLSYVLGESAAEDSDGRRQLGAGCQAYCITNREYARHPVSPTFHGRDIFAPAAAHLTLGVTPDHFGERIESLEAIPLPRPSRAADGTVTGHILHIDRFGNLITNLTPADLPAGPPTVEIGGHVINGLSRTYAEADGLLALIGSSDRLEISLRDGSARDYVGAAVGDEIRTTARPTVR
jgi:S-adenosylmethionine hydrolase